MSVLLLDRVSVKKTWDAISARIERRPVFQVVPEEAMNTLESVIMVNEDEAWDRWPSNYLDDQQHRVQFWKEAVLDAVPENERGLWAVYFHEYIASTMRGSDAAIDEDIHYSRASVGSVTVAHALRDAYATCAAGLEGYSVEWNS